MFIAAPAMKEEKAGDEPRIGEPGVGINGQCAEIIAVQPAIDGVKERRGKHDDFGNRFAAVCIIQGKISAAMDIVRGKECEKYPDRRGFRRRPGQEQAGENAKRYQLHQKPAEPVWDARTPAPCRVAAIRRGDEELDRHEQERQRGPAVRDLIESGNGRSWRRGLEGRPVIRDVSAGLSRTRPGWLSYVGDAAAEQKGQRSRPGRRQTPQPGRVRTDSIQPGTGAGNALSQPSLERGKTTRADQRPDLFDRTHGDRAALLQRGENVRAQKHQREHDQNQAQQTKNEYRTAITLPLALHAHPFPAGTPEKNIHRIRISQAR